MAVKRNPTVEELQLSSRFESLRRVLASDAYGEHRGKPLAFWALPSDRRLPLAFLGRTLGELISTPFEQLMATPGVGQKKIRSFIELLTRAVHTSPAQLSSQLAQHEPGGAPAGQTQLRGQDGFDPASVSEVVWGQWCATVKKHGLEGEILGRFAPSLRLMTRMIWTLPLGHYASHSLAEIRAMRTHGEKRVRAILEVFHTLHCLLGEVTPNGSLAVRLVPRAIAQAESWTLQMLGRSPLPEKLDVRRGLLSPLIDQLRLDAAPQLVHLAEARLGMSGPVTSVRRLARHVGLTRARVYQLFSEIGDIMAVRWPAGSCMLYQLHGKFHSLVPAGEQQSELEAFDLALDLFFPTTRHAGQAAEEVARQGNGQSGNGPVSAEESPAGEEESPEGQAMCAARVLAR